MKKKNHLQSEYIKNLRMNKGHIYSSNTLSFPQGDVQDVELQSTDLTL